MKLLNITLFSLLMGVTAFAYADAKLDKNIAKCDQLQEEMEEAKADLMEGDRAERELLDRTRNASDDQYYDEYMAAVRANKALKDKVYRVIPGKMDRLNCRNR